MSEEHVRDAYDASRNDGGSFISLVWEYSTNSADLACFIGSEFGLPVLDLDQYDLGAVPSDYRNLISEYQILPLLQSDTRLLFAVSDPTNLPALDGIRFGIELATDGVLVEPAKLEAAIGAVLSGSSDLTTSDMSELEVDELDDDVGVVDAPDLDAPVTRFVDKLLLSAVSQGASDLHLEPYDNIFRVRMRVDGMLREVARPPRNVANQVVARIKVMSRMDTSERRVPQDGRIRIVMGDKNKKAPIEFRVNVCPTLYGEKVVLRILNSSTQMLNLDTLGFSASQKELYKDALDSPYGMILITGPTGSGKSVSLYAGLNYLNDPGVNISTAEDPAELNLPGINQVNVNHQIGFGFAEALRSFLRQDPDIIMVGEIRDLETASIAIKAAQTGHLVLSTLHTNDAPQTLTRLVDMGVAPFNVASSVSLVIAQRLIRLLCENCKVAENLPRQVFIEEGFDPAEIDGLSVYKAVGCARCNDGYKGRVGVYQVMPFSEEMGRIVMSNGNAMDLANQANIEGVDDLRRSALRHVIQGRASLAEINRVTKD